MTGPDLHYRLEGTGGAPVVVLAHGIATDLTLWDGVAPILMSAGFRVLRYDARGHGGSAAPPGDYSLAMLGEDLLRLMDALGIPGIHLVGLSMGGMVGLGLALDHPGRLLSLVCCDARASAPPEYRQAWTSRAETVRARGMEPMVEPSVSRWFAPGFRDRKPAEAARVEAMVRRTAPAGYCGCAAALRDLDYGPRLHGITVPTLYLVGADDTGAPPAVMRSMQASTPGARYIEIPDAGHLSALEQPGAVATALVSFFSTLAGTEQNT